MEILKDGPIRKVLRERCILHSPESKDSALVDKLVTQVDAAIRDQEEAWKMYDKMRTDMVTVFPPGTRMYEIFLKIVADEMRHREDLYQIRMALMEKG